MRTHTHRPYTKLGKRLSRSPVSPSPSFGSHLHPANLVSSVAPTVCHVCVSVCTCVHGSILRESWASVSFFSYYFSEYLLTGKDFQRITIITPSNINSDSLISANIHSCLIFIHLFFKSQFIIGFFKSELKHCIWLEYLLFLPHFLKIIPPSFNF